jgi:hypothetical protein
MISAIQVELQVVAWKTLRAATGDQEGPAVYATEAGGEVSWPGPPDRRKEAADRV